MSGSVTFILGLPGAGKTSWARRQSGHIIGFDMIRIQDIFDHFPDAPNEFYEQRSEAAVLCRVISLLDGELRSFHSRECFIDESLTAFWPAEQLVVTARHYRVPVHMVVIDTPAKVCWERRRMTGFKESEFRKKVQEWQKNRSDILDLADQVVIVPGKYDDASI